LGYYLKKLRLFTKQVFLTLFSKVFSSFFPQQLLPGIIFMYPLFSSRKDGFSLMHRDYDYYLFINNYLLSQDAPMIFTNALAAFATQGRYSCGKRPSVTSKTMEPRRKKRKERLCSTDRGSETEN